MSLETNTICMLAPFNPKEREWYTNLVNNDMHSGGIKNLYNIMSMREDYVNPTMDGELS